MKKLSEITDYYYSDLAPVIKELDKKRQRVKHRILFYYSFVAVFLTGGAYYILTLSNEPDYFMIGVWYVVLMMVSFGVVMALLSKDYVKEFKQKVISPLIKFIDPHLHYDPERYIPESLLRYSGIVTSQIDRYGGNDYVSGEIDGVFIEFSDVKAQQRREDSEGHVEYVTIFEGVLLKAEFPKHFHSRTYVFPDTSEKKFGSLIGRLLQADSTSYGKLIRMDNPEFEKEFVVYGGDAIEAHYILTQSMMQRMLEFKKRVAHEVAFSFVGGEMFVAVYYDKDTLEPSIFGSLLDYKIAKEYIDTLYYALGIVEELKLNQKLWSKR